MSNELWLIGALTSLLMVFVVGVLSRPKRSAIYNQLVEIVSPERSFVDRVLIPLWERSVSFVLSLQPQGVSREVVRQNLMYAGQLGRFTPEEFYLGKIAGGIIFPAIPFVWFLVTPNGLVGVIMAGAGVLGYTIPNLWLARLIRRRQKAIRKEIITFVELLAIACEAGLHSTDAIRHVCRQLQGVLSDEWRHTLYACEAGIGKAEAFLALSQRNGVEELTQLISLLMQADRLGTPIARALHIQAQQMRMYRRNRITEAAHKAELKILFPLILFVFVPFAILLLAPAAMQFLGGLR